MDLLLVFISFFVIVVLFLLYRLVKFIRADADLTLLGHSLDPSYFSDKVVWVTGASSGIGEELCRQLSKIGAKVILSARSEDKLKSVLESLAHPENCRAFPLDVGDRESVRKAPQHVKSLFGRVDILINNAGVGMKAAFVEVSEDIARKVMEVDLLGTSFLTQGVVKSIMLEQGGGGHIVNVSSLSGKFAFPELTYYCAAKYGLIGLMDALRLEMLGKDIYVTNVCPGPTKTSGSENTLTAKGDKYGKKDFGENGLEVERCAQLILIGTSNKLREIWVSKHPALLLGYLTQYLPSLGYFLLKRNSA